MFRKIEICRAYRCETVLQAEARVVGLRAVGLCGWQVDYSTLVVRPSVFCYQSPIERRGVQVEVGPDDMHQYVGDGWKRLALGYVVFTYSFNVVLVYTYIPAVPLEVEETLLKHGSATLLSLSD